MNTPLRGSPRQRPGQLEEDVIFTARTHKRTRGQRLARPSTAPIEFPAMFGGGHDAAFVIDRHAYREHGYPATVERFRTTSGPQHTWQLVTVTTSAMLAGITVDHRSALGRPAVPAASPWRTGDDTFDAVYAVRGQSEPLVRAVLSPAVRDLLLHHPVQRLHTRGGLLTVRTLDDTAAKGLDEFLQRFLALAPISASVVTDPQLGEQWQLQPLAPGLASIY